MSATGSIRGPLLLAGVAVNAGCAPPETGFKNLFQKTEMLTVRIMYTFHWFIGQPYRDLSTLPRIFRHLGIIGEHNPEISRAGKGCLHMRPFALRKSAFGI